jgi:hypothetical protein
MIQREMKPKEQALELIAIALYKIKDDDGRYPSLSRKQAIQCALIVSETVIDTIWVQSYDSSNDDFKYWAKVKNILLKKL